LMIIVSSPIGAFAAGIGLPPDHASM
jgi:hypothetical protein